MRRRHRAAPLALALGLSAWGAPGCTSVVPDALRTQLDRAVTYPQVAQNPEALAGRIVLMGGEVLRAEPGGRGLQLTLAERPLSPVDESPMLGQESRGDLVVEVPGGMGASFRAGDVITVVGTVLGRAPGGGRPAVPHLESRSIYVWAVARPELPSAAPFR